MLDPLRLEILPSHHTQQSPFGAGDDRGAEPPVCKARRQLGGFDVGPHRGGTGFHQRLGDGVGIRAIDGARPQAAEQHATLGGHESEAIARLLDARHRAAVAAGCRDRVAAKHSGEAARQLRSVDPTALRSELDGEAAEQLDPGRAVVVYCWDAL